MASEIKLEMAKKRVVGGGEGGREGEREGGGGDAEERSPCLGGQGAVRN